MTGRFAPSPTGELHLGNLRTAVVAWLSARADQRPFLIRMEDLDIVQAKPEHAAAQLRDLAAIGIDWDGDVVVQSERFHLYQEALERLAADGSVYECYCSRRDIRLQIEAASRAPHGPPGSYPGTCRDLTDAEREERQATGRPPALRLRTMGESYEFVDRLVGRSAGPVDDVVLRRNDGIPAYNLAVVVDDGLQSVTDIVRGDDLLSSTPRHLMLQRRLGLDEPSYLHIPLVIGSDGERLAKRHGASTLRKLRDVGTTVADVITWIARSLDLATVNERPTLDQLLGRFEPAALPLRAVEAPDFNRRR
ncbi:tRNA glutamyl-Q(34) synthetase GluQRS [uncultured Ilumatobacter sp.]|uniref:tRNA glutamyl-Q(34) synthetase GluQRS n=1 Tax=uncultured Ilumatobacter sp. TaxID=879968 RepID=UPI00374EBE19